MIQMIDLSTCDKRFIVEYKDPIFGYETVFSSYPHFCGRRIGDGSPVELDTDEFMHEFRVRFTTTSIKYSSEALFDFAICEYGPVVTVVASIRY